MSSCWIKYLNEILQYQDFVCTNNTHQILKYQTNNCYRYMYYIVGKVIKHLFYGFLWNNQSVAPRPWATVSQRFSPYLGSTVWLFPSKPLNKSVEYCDSDFITCHHFSRCDSAMYILHIHLNKYIMDRNYRL